jgi:hypothetical protein
MNTQQQNVQVTQVVENKGCLSGCGTLFAVLLVVGLIVTYWYVAVPIAVLAAGGGAYFYFKRRGELPAPQPGAQDPWLDQISSRLGALGFSERTRNTGQQLEGVPLEGDICLDADDMRLFVNVFRIPSHAEQVSDRLKSKANIQAAMTGGQSGVVSQGRVVYVANGMGDRLQSARLESVIKTVGEVAPPTVGEEPQRELAPATRSGPETQIDVLDQLQKLGQLRDTGVLTKEEFEEKKSTLLKRL